MERSAGRKRGDRPAPMAARLLDPRKRHTWVHLAWRTTKPPFHCPQSPRLLGHRLPAGNAGLTCPNRLFVPSRQGCPGPSHPAACLVGKGAAEATSLGDLKNTSAAKPEQEGSEDQGGQELWPGSSETRLPYSPHHPIQENTALGAWWRHRDPSLPGPFRTSHELVSRQDVSGRPVGSGAPSIPVQWAGQEAGSTHAGKNGPHSFSRPGRKEARIVSIPAKVPAPQSPAQQRGLRQPAVGPHRYLQPCLDLSLLAPLPSRCPPSTGTLCKYRRQAPGLGPGMSLLGQKWPKFS